MEPKKATGRRNALFIAFFLFAVIVAGALVLIYTTRPVTNLESAGVQANQLMTSAGGPAKVCDEANRMFRRFEVSNVKFFYTASELKDFPAIAALGAPDWITIFSGSPPYMRIRVDTHRDGFIIKIVDTNSPGKYVKSPGDLELVDSCVFVHR
jgi:hypothetical protein